MRYKKSVEVISFVVLLIENSVVVIKVQFIDKGLFHFDEVF